MFTGLVEGTARVRAFERRAAGARLVLEPPALAPGLAPWEPLRGESVALSGCCLSVVDPAPDGSCAFDLSAETLARTWFGREGRLAPGRPVNVERSLRLGDRLGGHLVSGHVDGLGRLSAVEDPGDGGRLMRFEVPEGMQLWLVDKGSITIDGISLTVVDPRDRTFAVAVIPETLSRTTLGTADVGDEVHLEADMVGKWVERLVREARG